MQQRDFERIRVDIKQGWELSAGLTESPYVKGRGPMTAVFNYAYYEDGEKVEKRVVTPSMKALTKEELLDGSQAHIHQIPQSLVKQALDLFARAAAPQQPQASNNNDVIEPQRQMAASIPSPRSMAMGG